MESNTHTYDDWQIETYANKPKEQTVDKLDFSKPETLKRRDGGEFRVYATDGSGQFCIHGAVFILDEWEQASWRTDGTYMVSSGECDYDLISKPPRVTGWLNVYDRNGPNLVANEIYTNLDTAKGWAGSDCIGQVFVDAEVQK
jgi:hypothetical protein